MTCVTSAFPAGDYRILTGQFREIILKEQRGWENGYLWT